MSKEQDIQAGNKLIAEFMGVKKFKVISGSNRWDIGDGHWYSESTLKYHSSWNWFHCAFDKFKTMQLKEWDQGEGTAWNHRYSFHLCLIGAAMVHTTISEAFERLVKAIQWYNQQPPINR